MRELVPTPKSRFYRVICPKCKNIQIIFSKVSTVVKCSRCGKELVLPTGGKAIIKGKILTRL